MVPSTVLSLFVDQLALEIINCFVADDGVESEDLLIGLLVLHHLRADTKALLEEQIDTFDGTDCSLSDT